MYLLIQWFNEISHLQQSLLLLLLLTLKTLYARMPKLKNCIWGRLLVTIILGDEFETNGPESFDSFKK
jgi:hypothetical protein